MSPSRASSAQPTRRPRRRRADLQALALLVPATHRAVRLRGSVCDRQASIAKSHQHRRRSLSRTTLKNTTLQGCHRSRLLAWLGYAPGSRRCSVRAHKLKKRARLVRTILAPCGLPSAPPRDESWEACRGSQIQAASYSWDESCGVRKLGHVPRKWPFAAGSCLRTLLAFNVLGTPARAFGAETSLEGAWSPLLRLRTARILIRDRGGKYGGPFDEIFRGEQIRIL
jgi:hypothetical protein